jgi:hypothetical protein
LFVGALLFDAVADEFRGDLDAWRWFERRILTHSSFLWFQLGIALKIGRTRSSSALPQDQAGAPGAGTAITQGFRRAPIFRSKATGD